MKDWEEVVEDRRQRMEVRRRREVDRRWDQAGGESRQAVAGGKGRRLELAYGGSWQGQQVRREYANMVGGREVRIVDCTRNDTEIRGCLIVRLREKAPSFPLLDGSSLQNHLQEKRKIFYRLVRPLSAENDKIGDLFIPHVRYLLVLSPFEIEPPLKTSALILPPQRKVLWSPCAISHLFTRFRGLQVL